MAPFWNAVRQVPETCSLEQICIKSMYDLVRVGACMCAFVCVGACLEGCANVCACNGSKTTF